MTDSVLHLDFETYSSASLKKVGVENYVRAPDFAVTVIGWAFDNMPVVTWTWPGSGALPQRVRDHIAGGGMIRAWNASFEWHVLTHRYSLDVPFAQMDCTMQRALAYGLPGSLQEAGEAMRLAVTKDRSARDLMMRMGRPRANGSAWHLDQGPQAQAMLAALASYCAGDVEAERALDGVLPALPDFERELSLLDAQINQKGVPIDAVAVAALHAASLVERQKLNRECDRLTDGAVSSPSSQTEKLKDWLHDKGWTSVADLQKETVAELLGRTSGSVPEGSVRRVLEIRQLAAKSSLAKLERMREVASRSDGRARNLLQFYGAGRTGRWAGRLIQVQNLPRVPDGLQPQRVIDVARVDPHGLELFWERPMTAIACSLRSCLVAREGSVLVSLDLSQIEARVLAWLAGQQNVLEAFRRGEDIYAYAARQQGSDNRQLGKVLVLACGYGMGPDKFRETAAGYGVDLTAYEAAEAVYKWREDNAEIRRFWWNMTGATLEALGTRVDKPGFTYVRRALSGGRTVFEVGRQLRLTVSEGKLLIRKPNGVCLFYHNPRVTQGTHGPELTYDGVDQKTGKWLPIRTYGGRFVENVTQSVARDIMAAGMIEAGMAPVMTVHDEIVWEVPAAAAALMADAFQRDVEQGPSWAAGLPLASKIKISRRYGG